MSTELAHSLQQALARRAPLIEALQSEGCDTWRVFHGRNEGRENLAIDRYGPHLLAQSWGTPLSNADRATVEDTLGPIQWRHRGEKQPQSPPFTFQELGLRYTGRIHHKGLDPWLFLDFRVARRWLLDNAQGARVLNTFAYTCGAGLAAAKGGARSVLNVDHGAWCLEAGQQNAAANALEMEFLRADFFAATRQFAGLALKGRGRRKVGIKLDKRQFDLVILDPPTFAKGALGAVDILRDYPALAKPCLMALAPGGRLLATNHHAHVTREQWLAQILRTGEKCGRPIVSHHWLEVEADFPSPDGQGPLKILVCQV